MGMSSVTSKNDESSITSFLDGACVCVCVCVCVCAHVYTACSSNRLRSFDFSNACLEGIKRGA